MKRFLSAVGRVVLWPWTRFFDPRFRGLADQADSQHADLAERIRILQVEAIKRETLQHELTIMRDTLADIARSELDATQEANELITRTLGELLAETTAMTRLLSALRLRDLEGAAIEDLDEKTADFLNYASSHRGFAAQRGVWFNPPISLRYGPSDVAAADVNERIVELPYAFRALNGLDAESTVLDIGAAESIVAFSLASLGYQTTALDLHPYPLEHPRLQSVQADILTWESPNPFDAVLCISTLEHIGLGAYGDDPSEAADIRAMKRIQRLTKPGGRLVLTVPFGAASGDRSQRGYEQADLDRLLDGWTVDDLTVVRRRDGLSWVVDDAAGADDARRVALVSATRPPH
jgi:SAM-dependent methyltransferase